VAAAKGDDIDILASYAEPPLVALNLFHLRHGQVVDRREFFWEDQLAFDPPEFLLLAAAATLSGCAVHSHRNSRAGGFRGPRGAGRAAERKAQPEGRNPHPAARSEEGAVRHGGEQRKHSFEARFRVLKPSSRAIREALQEALNLPSAPERIECFDISHIQGTDQVASMVVWEDGA